MATKYPIHQKSNEPEQLTLSSKDNDEECVMHSKNDNIKMMINNKEEERFQSLYSSYQIGLETSLKCIDFIFDCVHLLYYKCHKKIETILNHI